MTQTQPTPPPHEDEGEKLVLNSPEEAKTPRDFLLWAGVIVLTVMTAFSPALHGKFLWDDDRHVEQNRGLRDAGGLVNIWTGHWRYLLAGPDERPKLRVFTPQYYPVTHTSFWIEAQLLQALGKPLTPTLFHVTNMLLHAAGAILLWFILRELAVPGAWVAAAVWALHPMQAESVAWISERKNVLAGAFVFASILVYLRRYNLPALAVDPGDGKALTPQPARATPDWYVDPLYWLAFGLFLLALLSKTVTSSMPAVVLLLIWWKRGRLDWRRDVVPLLPFFVIGFILAMFTSWIERRYVGASGADWALSPVQRILVAGNAIWFYAGKLLVPLKLTFFYPKWNLDPSNAGLWLAVIGAVAMPVVLFLLRHRIGRGPLVAWLIFCGVLVPALGFFNIYPLRYSYVADHFQYLAAPALIALIVAALARLIRRGGPGAAPAGYAVAGLALVVLAGLSFVQAGIYDSHLTLWRDTSAKNPNNPSVRYNHGVALFGAVDEVPIDQQDQIVTLLDQAAGEFEAATRLDPNHDRAWTMWGQVLLEKHDAKQAIEKFDKALSVRPDSVDALSGRGQAFFQLKDWNSALSAYQDALKSAVEKKGTGAVAPIKAATIYQMLGKIHDQTGNTAAAREAFAQAVQVAPGTAVIHYDYGTLLAKLGDPASTQPATTQAGATQPAPPAPATQARVGTLIPATPDQVNAAFQFGAAIEAAPDFIDARISLAELMLKVGNLAGAQTQLVAAARIDAGYPRLMEAAKKFDAAFRAIEASTRPATTQASEDRVIAPTTRRGD